MRGYLKFQEFLISEATLSKHSAAGGEFSHVYKLDLHHMWHLEWKRALIPHSTFN